MAGPENVMEEYKEKIERQRQLEKEKELHNKQQNPELDQLRHEARSAVVSSMWALKTALLTIMEKFKRSQQLNL